MRIFSALCWMLILLSCSEKKDKDQLLAQQILDDTRISKVDSLARELLKNGFIAGNGYPMVWSRDLNTFIETSAEVYDRDTLREKLLFFFHFQQDNGELLDGYVPKEAFNWDDPNTYESSTAPNHLGFKNTVETDQETSLIQAIYKYIRVTNDRSILDETVAGESVYQRIVRSIDFLLTEKTDPDYGLITGATTFDWGDVQVEGGAVVDIDSLSHIAIDVYDNAMMIIALNNLSEIAPNNGDREKWRTMATNFANQTKAHLWDQESMKFIPHLYIDESPFPSDFNENAIFYHGGTAVAIEAGLLNEQEIEASIAHMKSNVEKSGAPSIGLTLYPPYPSEVLGETISPPFDYQNGGDWTWFGGRMIQQLVIYGYVDQAYELLAPMLDRVVKNNDFYEWYHLDGSPAGSSGFKGSAGVLAKSCQLLLDWAETNK